MIIVAVDPGKSGAIVKLDSSGAPLSVEPMPLVTSTKGRDEYDERRLAEMLDFMDGHGPERRIVYEALQTLPPKMGGGVANFQRGLAVGLLRGVCAALGFASIAYRPQIWQREMLAGTLGDDTKQRAIIAAGRLFPGTCLVCLGVGGLHVDHGRRTKPRDGAADALLLAEFARRRFAGQAVGAA